MWYRNSTQVHAQEKENLTVLQKVVHIINIQYNQNRNKPIVHQMIDKYNVVYPHKGM